MAKRSTSFAQHVAQEGLFRFGDVKAAHVENFIGDLLARHSPATASNRFRALQQFFVWL